jgi:hypothetical protein
MTGCVNCGATGDLEPVNTAGNMACRQVNLCALRAAGHDPVHVALTLIREMAKLAWADNAARQGIPWPTSPEWTAAGVLTGTDLARLHLVLEAAAEQIMSPSGFPELVRQARKDMGCRRCGAIGREDCMTSGGNRVPRTHGTWGPHWHAGRTL